MLQQFKQFIAFLVLSVLVSVQVNAQFSVNFQAEAGNFNAYTLTHDSTWTRGAIWNTDQISMEEPFDFTFEVFLGEKDDNGADGLVFAFQAVDANQGGLGQGIGIGNVQPSLFVELDTWMNPEEEDPAFDHIAIGMNGNVNHSDTNVNALAGPIPILTGSDNAEDGEWHSLRIAWDPVDLSLDVYLDCDLRLSHQGDVINEIFEGDPMVYYGFTSATGGFSNHHQVRVPYQDNIPDTLADAQICVGATHQVEIPAGSNWSWATLNGLGASIDNPEIDAPTLSPTETTTYIGTYDFNCERRTDSLTVYVSDELNAQITTVDSIFCQGDDAVVLSATPKGGAWSGEGILDAISGTWQPQTLSGEEHYVTYSVGDGECLSEDSILMVVAQKPIAAPGDNDTICIGESITMQAAPGANDYTWAQNSSLSELNVPITVAAPLESQWYYLTVTDGTCAGSDSIHIAVLNRPELSLLPYSAPCPGESIELTAQGADLFGWFQNGVLLAEGPLLNLVVDSLTDLTLIGTDINLCSASIAVPVAVNERPFAEITGPGSICPGDTVTLNASGGVTMNWIDPVDVISSNQGQLTISPQDSATYHLHVTSTDGCTDTTEFEITVTNDLRLDLTEVSIICAGELVQLSAQDGSEVTWQPDESLAATVGTTVSAIPLDSTWYFGSVTSGNCFAEDSILVSVLPQVEVKISSDTSVCKLDDSFALAADVEGGIWSGTGIDDSIAGIFSPLMAADGKNEVFYNLGNPCANIPSIVVNVEVSPLPKIQPIPAICDTLNSVLLQASIPNGTWSGVGVDAQNALFHASQSGKGEFMVHYAVAIGGCQGRDSLTVSVHPIYVELPSDTSVCSMLNQGVLLEPMSNGNEYYWNSGDESSALYTDVAGYYAVSVTNDAGCIATDSITITSSCGCDVWLPNAFTPDGNHKNDAFTGIPTDPRFPYEMSIFNRWGELLWQAETHIQGWDGQFNGLPAKEDVYIVRGTCGVTEFSGKVSLLR